MTDTNDIREALADAYEVYEAKRRRAKRRALAKMEEELADDRAVLSRVVHDAYDAGVRKDEIRRIVKAYNNSAVWLPIWEAYTPDHEHVDLRTKQGRVVNAPAKEGDDWVELVRFERIQVKSTGHILENLRFAEHPTRPNQSGTWDGHDPSDHSADNWADFVAASDYLTKYGSEAPGWVTVSANDW